MNSLIHHTDVTSENLPGSQANGWIGDGDSVLSELTLQNED